MAREQKTSRSRARKTKPILGKKPFDVEDRLQNGLAAQRKLPGDHASQAKTDRVKKPQQPRGVNVNRNANSKKKNANNPHVQSGGKGSADARGRGKPKYSQLGNDNGKTRKGGNDNTRRIEAEARLREVELEQERVNFERDRYMRMEERMDKMFQTLHQQQRQITQMWNLIQSKNNRAATRAAPQRGQPTAAVAANQNESSTWWENDASYPSTHKRKKGTNARQRSESNSPMSEKEASPSPVRWSFTHGHGGQAN